LGQISRLFPVFLASSFRLYARRDRMALTMTGESDRKGKTRPRRGVAGFLVEDFVIPRWRASDEKTQSHEEDL
jgi:hypothetical protein